MAMSKSSQKEQKEKQTSQPAPTPKKRSQKPLESSTLFKSAVKRLVRERLKDSFTISSQSVTILSSIAFDFFNTIGASAGNLSKSVNKMTVGSSEIKGAIRLELGGKELSNNIIVDIESAMKKYGKSK